MCKVPMYSFFFSSQKKLLFSIKHFLLALSVNIYICLCHCDRCTYLYAILFGDEQHLSSLHVVQTLRTALLVSLLFIMVVRKCERCALFTIRASAFFFCAILLRVLFQLRGLVIATLVPFLRFHCETSASRDFRPHGDEEKKKLPVGSVIPL